MTDRTPREATLNQVRDIWKRIANTEDVHDNDTFAAIGGDSIAAMICLNEILETFNVEVDLDLLLDDVTTLTAFTDVVIAASNVTADG